MTTETSIEDESDEDLFLYIACRVTAGDEEIANRAFAEIHRRHVKSLYKRCLNLCRRLPEGESFAEDLTYATFARAYERTDQYRASSNPDTAAGRWRTLFWLCRIARNLLLDHLRNPNRPGPFNDSDLDVDTSNNSSEDFAVFFNDQEQPLNSRHEYKMVTEAFETLDKRTQEVLLVTYLQRDRSPKKTHMLRGTTQLLADRLGTSPDNIRRIRRNGIRAIKDYLEKEKRLGDGR